eukprot:m.312689 g.312689  ORF g.312689 m.312689 type:complete len:74 (-) comp23049_c0_seq1:115-336(-)
MVLCTRASAGASFSALEAGVILRLESAMPTIPLAQSPLARMQIFAENDKVAEFRAFRPGAFGIVLESVREKSK